MTACGTQLPHAKLTPNKVRAIRPNVHGWPRRKWAELYGVHVRTIDKVCCGYSWRHV